MKKNFQPSISAFHPILPSIAAILLILAYPNFNLQFIAWFSLVPLFLALENNNAKQRFVKGYIFGIVFFSGILYWLFFSVSIPGAIVLVLMLSFAPAIFCCLYLSAERYQIYAIAYVPAAWVLTEYLRTYLFTGFPWALLGYSQSFNIPLIQIANITGVYGVSFLIILVNFGLYLTLRKAPHRFYILIFILALITTSLVYGERAIRRVYPAQTLRVSVIQGNIPQNIKWDSNYRTFIMDQYKRITKNAISETMPHLVIWPETSLPGYIEEKDLHKAISDLAKSEETYLLIGTLHGEGLNAFNSACLISNKGTVLKRYDKIHLVPFGEFIPFEDKFPWIRSSMGRPVGDYIRGKEYTVFKFKPKETISSPEVIKKTDGFYSFSCLSCYEDIFPELSRRFVKEGACFLINLTNDAWFGKTSAPYQHLQGSIFRAVENHVPVLRAANTGVSCIIDSNGQITKVVKKGKDEIFIDGYATGNISATLMKTFYTRFGDVFSWACIILVLLKIGTGIYFKTKQDR